MLRRSDRGFFFLRGDKYYYAINLEGKFLNLYSVPVTENNQIFLTYHGAFILTKDGNLYYRAPNKDETLISLYSLPREFNKKALLYADKNFVVLAGGTDIVTLFLSRKNGRVFVKKEVSTRFKVEETMCGLHHSLNIGVRKDYLGEDILVFFSPIGGFPFFAYKGEHLNGLNQIVVGSNVYLVCDNKVTAFRISPMLLEAVYLAVIGKNLLNEAPLLYEYVKANKERFWYYLDLHEYVGEYIAKNQLEIIESYLIKNYRESLFSLIRPLDSLTLQDQVRFADAYEDYLLLGFDDYAILYHVNLDGKFIRVKRFNQTEDWTDVVLLKSVLAVQDRSGYIRSFAL